MPDLFHDAVSLHRAGRLREAERLYRQHLAVHPHDPDALHMLGLLAAHADRPEVATEFFHAALAIRPDDATLHAELAEIYRRLNRLDEAEFLARRAVALDPDLPATQHNLGIILHQSGRHADAIATFRRAAELDPNHADTFYHLGNALRDFGRPEDALSAYRHALAIDPDHLPARGNLAIALRDLGHTANAIAALRELLARQPDDPKAHIHLARLLEDSGDLPAALPHYQRAVALDRNAPEHLVHLALALEKVNRPEQVIPLLRDALDRGLDSPEARFHLAALTGTAPPPAAPSTHVIATFNRMAPTFDHHLTETLQCRIPELLHAAVTAALPPASPLLDILDLGCGTGLCGLLFRPLARTLVGVDLAPAMLARARDRKLYDELHAADLLTILRARPEACDLLLAADVFPYIGDLADTFAAATAALRPGGLLAFSVESLDPPTPAGYALRPTHRYAHTPAYLRSLALLHHFTECSLTTATLRLEVHTPVSGFIVVFQKP